MSGQEDLDEALPLLQTARQISRKAYSPSGPPVFSPAKWEWFQPRPERVCERRGELIEGGPQQADGDRTPVETGHGAVYPTGL